MRFFQSGRKLAGLTCSAIGHFGGRCRWFESVLLIAGALLLIMPGWVTDLIGIIVVGAIFGLQKKRQAFADATVSFPAG